MYKLKKRICRNCNISLIEIEYHFLLMCSKYRQKYLKKDICLTNITRIINYFGYIFSVESKMKSYWLRYSSHINSDICTFYPDLPYLYVIILSTSIISSVNLCQPIPNIVFALNIFMYVKCNTFVVVVFVVGGVQVHIKILIFFHFSLYPCSFSF